MAFQEQPAGQRYKVVLSETGFSSCIFTARKQSPLCGGEGDTGEGTALGRVLGRVLGRHSEEGYWGRVQGAMEKH